MMRSKKTSSDWNYLVHGLKTLQGKWEGKTAKGVNPGRRLWAHGVVVGIETGRHRLEELKSDSPGELVALVEEWKKFAKLEVTGPAAVSIRGIDFGIQLVSRCVRQYLSQLMPQEPPGFSSPQPKSGTPTVRSKSGHRTARRYSQDNQS